MRTGSQKSKFKLNGEVTRLLIRRRGFRLFQVAGKLRISNSTLTRYLDGEILVNSVTLAALAEVLNTPDIVTLISIPDGIPRV